MKLLISLVVLLLVLVPVLGQNTIANWNGDFFWDAPVGPAPDGYNLYKSSTPGGPYTKVNTGLILGLSFNDPDAIVGDYYVVSAVNDIGIEGLSSEIQLVGQNPPLLLRLFQVIASFFKWIFGGFA